MSKEDDGCVIDFDEILNEVNEAEDLDIIDNFHHNTRCSITKESQDLKCIQQDSFERKSVQNSSKGFLAELGQLEGDGQNKISILRDMIEEKKLEVKELYLTQVSDIEKFENDALKSSEEFNNYPKKFKSEYLMHKVDVLLRELEEQKNELYVYRQELMASKNKLNEHSVGSDNNGLNDTVYIFEESISSVEELNKKLVQSVEELKNKTAIMRYEVGMFNKKI